MSPLMQTICDHLQECCLEHYIDGLERDICAMELDQLRSALAAVLPNSCQELLRRYDDLQITRIRIQNEAMFQAAYAAARELT